MVSKMLMLLCTLGAVLYGMLQGTDGDSSSLEARFARLEAKVDFILNYLGLTYTETSTRAASIEDMVRAGHRLEAIKAYRALHGATLQQAQAAVEAMDRQINPSPEPGNQPSAQFLEQVKSLILQGQRPQAVKLYLEHTHLTLSEAKAEIDALEQQLW